MSLDVYLTHGTRQETCWHCDSVRTVDNVVYSANITHNLGQMAAKSGCYEALWRPDGFGFERAAEIVPVLQEALARLEAEPERFKAFNPANGWGTYDGFVQFVRAYLAACREWPEAKVSVSR